MRILIYGAGALGQAVGCMLAADGHNVDMVLRNRFIEAIQARGLSVTGLYGEYHVEADQLGLYSSCRSIPPTSYDYVLITTKSYDTATAVAEISLLADQDFTVVTMQNGCGNLETVLEQFGEDRTLAGRVITGFEIVQPGMIRITVSADAVHIGASREKTQPEAVQKLAAAIDKAGLPCVSTTDIRSDLFAKLLYNCALNPLGAILGVHYGALAEDPAARRIMDRIITETFTVIRALNGTTAWQDPELYQAVFYEKQIPATYNHRPSMLQDIENHKPTEVEALTGFVSAQGNRLGIQTPFCDLLSDLVRFKEHNYGESSK